MCEPVIYSRQRRKSGEGMEGVVRLTSHDGKVLLEGILGDSLDVKGKLSEVNMIAQEAIIVNRTEFHQG